MAQLSKAAFDRAQFEKDVLEALDDLKRLPPGGAAKKAAKKSAAKRPKTPETPTKPRASVMKRQSASVHARDWLRNSAVLAILCPGLKGLAADSGKIARRLTYFAVSMTAVGVPPDAYLYASMSLWAAKFGVDVLCAAHRPK